MMINKGKLSKNEIKQIIIIVNAILKQNYFTYDGKYFVANDGVGMGGPLSLTITQIFLNHFEKKHIMNISNPYYEKNKKYRRFVDDTLFVFSGTHRNITSSIDLSSLYTQQLPRFLQIG